MNDKFIIGYLFGHFNAVKDQLRNNDIIVTPTTYQNMMKEVSTSLGLDVTHSDYTNAKILYDKLEKHGKNMMDGA